MKTNRNTLKVTTLILKIFELTDPTHLPTPHKSYIHNTCAAHPIHAGSMMIFLGDPDVVHEDRPVPEGAVRKMATFQQFLLTGQFYEQKRVVGDALTRAIMTARIHDHIHEECITHTKSGVYCTNGDFHTQMAHYGYMLKTFDKGLGHTSPGTFQNLKTAISRTAATGNPKKSFTEDERLITDVTCTHIMGFAMKYFGMKKLDSKPTRNGPAALNDWEDMDDSSKKAWFDQAMSDIVEATWTWSLDGFTEHEIPKTPIQQEEANRADAAKSLYCRFCDRKYIYGGPLQKHERHECTKRLPIPSDEVFKIRHCSKCNRGFTVDEKLNQHEAQCTINEPATTEKIILTDGVNNYALRMMNEGLLSMALRDFIRYGNGEMVVKFYKWLLPLSRIQSNKSKYATESLYIYTSLNYLLSPRMSHQVTWNRFCNKSGRGRNIPMDRRLEHLNRLAKALMKAAGHQNLTETLVGNIGSSITPLNDMGEEFDHVSGIGTSNTYIDRDFWNEEDERVMLNILVKADVFNITPGRYHNDFKGINANPFADLDIDKLRAYVMSWGNRYCSLQKGLYARMYPT